MTQRLLVLDVETTISNKGNPSDTTNKLCYVGIKYLDTGETLLLNTLEKNYAEVITNVINGNTVIGFNLKFDIRWLLRYNVNISNTKFVDLQIMYFLYKNQRSVMPSLNIAAEEFGIHQKLDIVKTEYWDKGIDTPLIPTKILEEYLKEDLNITGLLYEKILTVFPKNKERLFTLQCLDMVLLSEAELEGLTYDTKAIYNLAEHTAKDITTVRSSIGTAYPDIHINWSSGHHLSTILFGGGIPTFTKTCIGRYKTGAKAGEPKYKNELSYTTYPGLCKPNPSYETLATKGKEDSELTPQGRVYKTGADDLKEYVSKNQRNKELAFLVDNLLKLAELEKLYSTYLTGIPELCLQNNWVHGKIHGQFNQCVTATGRLSSSKPNLQNFPSEMDVLIVSKY